LKEKLTENAITAFKHWLKIVFGSF
jgi:hypothetical protein